MAKLSAEEESLFKRLKDKLDAPEAPQIGKTIQGIVNFANPEEVALAVKHGFLSPDSDDNGGDDKDDKDDKNDPPKRRGYFND